jgi:hypothetical protein
VVLLPHGAALCAQCQVEKKAAQLAYQRHYQPGITDRVQMEGQRRRSGKGRERDGTSKILLHLEDAEIMDQLFFVPLSCVLKGGNNDSNTSAKSSVNTNV